MSQIEITEEMTEWFTVRTRAHLFLVRKWSDRIADHMKMDSRVDNILLNRERDEHDKGKWLEPEITPYIWLTWDYREKRKGRELVMPLGMRDKIHEATFHHIKAHQHHPEYWDADVAMDALNSKDRDKPAETMVDGTQMPLTYVAAMCADWFAMSEELGTCPFSWAKNNINIRWKFMNDQVDLIYDLMKDVWEKKK